jgi:hypothetical protein
MNKGIIALMVANILAVAVCLWALLALVWPSVAQFLRANGVKGL